MLTPRTREHLPFVPRPKYVPAPGETVYVADHRLFLPKTFVDKMNAYYDMAVNCGRPGDPANTGRKADARDLWEVVRHCYYAPPETHGLVLDRDRIGFRHTDFPGYMFVAVLEGVTPDRPTGELTFISMVHEAKPPADVRRETAPPPAVDWPPPDCPRTEALTRLERGLVAVKVWINAAPDRHPKLDEVYALKRRILAEQDRLLSLPDDDWTIEGD
jgi:hypothetical protein